MKILKIKINKGFTLIETMVAVFILMIAINAFFGLIAGSIFNARYAKNEITANYLAQEAMDYIRNDRDTVAFQQMNSGGGWANFISRYDTNGCFSGNGCIVEPSIGTVVACSGALGGGFGSLPCPIFRYDESGNNANKDFYTYIPNVGVPSNFKRQVIMYQNANIDELDIKVTVEWQNGTLSRSKTTRMSLLNWQKNF